MSDCDCEGDYCGLTGQDKRYCNPTDHNYSIPVKTFTREEDNYDVGEILVTRLACTNCGKVVEVKRP